MAKIYQNVLLLINYNEQILIYKYFFFFVVLVFKLFIKPPQCREIYRKKIVT